MAGGLVLFSYAVWHKDPVFILGQSMGLVIYLRNLCLIHAEHHSARQTPGTDQGLGPVAAALLVAGALISFRVVLVFFDQTELYTDEAQYWFWGQDLAFGAYSKPPLIGWVIQLSTDFLGQTAGRCGCLPFCFMQ